MVVTGRQGDIDRRNLVKTLIKYKRNNLVAQFLFSPSIIKNFQMEASVENSVHL